MPLGGTLGAKQGTILVADDDPAFIEMVASWLEPEGFTLAVAADGVRACELAESAAPDAVLLDLLLPRLDGYGVLLKLRAHEATRRVPVIIVSGEASADHAPLAASLGASAYLEKPFGRARLLEALGQALGSRPRP